MMMMMILMIVSDCVKVAQWHALHTR